MTEIYVVCEGQTEETFIGRVLAPAFQPDGIFIKSRSIETSPGHSGGALSIDRVRRFLRNTLREKRNAYVTTLFDLYRLDPDYPGYEQSRRIADPLQRATLLEQNLAQDIITIADVRTDRFIAYLQPYEFEALLFSDIRKLTEIEPGWGQFAERLSAGCKNAPSPEHINDGPDTHPSARLKNTLSPTYRKKRHGPLAAEQIGLAAIQQACAHFAGWLEKLRRLPPLV